MKSLTVDSSGDAGERLEEDRAVSLVLITWQSSRYPPPPPHVQTGHFVPDHGADSILCSFFPRLLLSTVGLELLLLN